jgi:hypothetical protein
MKIELLAFKSKNMATGEEQTFEQYRIVVDGTLVGYKGWKFGSKCCFIGRLSPLDKTLIEEEISQRLGDDAAGIMPAEYDPTEENEDEDHYDDFAN